MPSQAARQLAAEVDSDDERWLGMEDLEERIAKLKAMINRMDMRRDNGFIVDERE